MIRNGAPGVISFALRNVPDELKELESIRLQLVLKYGTVKDGDKKKSVSPEDENWAKFQEEFSKVLDMETEINIQPVSIQEFKDVKYLNPLDMKCLEYCILESDRNKE